MNSGCPNVVLIFVRWTTELRNMELENYGLGYAFDGAMLKL